MPIWFGGLGLKAHFPGFYRPDAEAFQALWKEATFVLDANVLLNLYRYPQKARDELLSVFARIADRLWVPYQAALEYQLNRLSVIAEQKGRFGEVRKVVSKVIPTLEGEFGQLQLRDRHALIDPTNLVASLKSHIDNYISELDALETSQGNVHDNDSIRDELDKLLANRIGPRPTQEDVNKISELGEKRYKIGTPPGFRDEKKNSLYALYSYDGVQYQAKYGDLLIWFQIIEFAKTKKEPSIIFVTDDQKQDWWWVVDSQGKKNLGPRAELVSEISQQANVKIFYMYTSTQFLKYTKEYLGANVSEEAIGQVKDVAQSAFYSTWLATRQSFLAERLVREWLSEQYPEASVDERTSWPDFLLRMEDSGRVIGCDVKHVKRTNFADLNSIFSLAATNIVGGLFSEFLLVVVFREAHEAAKLARFIENGKVNAPLGVSITVGVISERQDGTHFFKPILSSA
jgi:hypothetical protein